MLELNHRHTVSDLYARVAELLLPEPALPFALRGGFPPRALSRDDARSLKDAGLLASSVTVVAAEVPEL